MAGVGVALLWASTLAVIQLRGYGRHHFPHLASALLQCLPPDYADHFHTVNPQDAAARLHKIHLGHRQWVLVTIHCSLEPAEPFVRGSPDCTSHGCRSHTDPAIQMGVWPSTSVGSPTGRCANEGGRGHG
jgi:hypothetical protein